MTLRRLGEEHLLAALDAGVNLKARKRERAELFMDLPSRKDYPEYFKVIEKPISLNLIRKKAESRAGYKSEADFRADVQLLAENAREFNEASSEVCKDAVAVAAAIEAALDGEDEEAKGKRSRR